MRMISIDPSSKNGVITVNPPGLSNPKYSAAKEAKFEPRFGHEVGTPIKVRPRLGLLISAFANGVISIAKMITPITNGI